MQYVILLYDVAVGSIWHTTITMNTTNNHVQLSFFAPLQKSSIEVTIVSELLLLLSGSF